jgi:hypothetical protein
VEVVRFGACGDAEGPGVDGRTLAEFGEGDAVLVD